MSRMMSSLRPFGIFSSSMAVTKPYWYSCPASFSIGLSFLSVLSVLPGGGEARAAFPFHGRGLERDGMGHLGQRDPVERLLHHPVDLHPVALHDARLLDAAVARGSAAVGHADRALEGADDLRHGDPVRLARQGEA